MRTTITLDDQIAKALKDTAHRTGKPLQQVVNETLRAGLATGRAFAMARPYRVKPTSLGGVIPGLDLHKALRLADALEERDIARKLSLRK